MIPPSSTTPLQPLPEQRTTVAPYGWLRRHAALVTAVAPFASGGAAWLAGVLGGVDPIKAFQQLGAPVATIVLLVCALVWTYVIHIPQIVSAAEKTRQLLLAAQAAEIAEIVRTHSLDREAWLSTTREQAEESKQQRRVLEELAQRMGRLEETLSEVPTSPGSPRHAPTSRLGRG